MIKPWWTLGFWAGLAILALQSCYGAGIGG